MQPNAIAEVIMPQPPAAPSSGGGGKDGPSFSDFLQGARNRDSAADAAPAEEKVEPSQAETATAGGGETRPQQNDSRADNREPRSASAERPANGADDTGGRPREQAAKGDRAGESGNPAAGKGEGTRRGATPAAGMADAKARLNAELAGAARAGQGNAQAAKGGPAQQQAQANPQAQGQAQELAGQLAKDGWRGRMQITVESGQDSKENAARQASATGEKKEQKATNGLRLGRDVSAAARAARDGAEAVEVGRRVSEAVREAQAAARAAARGTEAINETMPSRATPATGTGTEGAGTAQPGGGTNAGLHAGSDSAGTTQAAPTQQAAASSHSQSAGSAAQSARVFTPQAVTDQVAVQISKAVQSGNDRISIQLKPESLGRIEVRLDIAHDGRVHATITTDRPDTLDLMQRDTRALERALQEAGLQTDTGSLSFNLRGHNQQAPTNGAANGGSLIGQAEGDEPSAEATAAGPSPGAEYAGTERIDITV